MTKKEKNINKKNLCDKYGVKITISEVLTDEYDSNKVYFPNALVDRFLVPDWPTGCHLAEAY